MECKKCGAILFGESGKCIKCGEVISEEAYKTIVDEKNIQRCGGTSGIAQAGFIVGIVSVCTFFLGSICVALSVPGIVLSSIGLNSKYNRRNARIGLILSIIGTIIATAFSVYFEIILDL